MKSAHCAGFTLAELLVVVGLIAITARVVVPSLSFGDANAVSLAASEAGNALRLARSEAVRSGRAVLVDAGTAGRLKLWYADCTASGPYPAVVDPATRRAADIAVAGGPLTNTVVMTAAFTPAAGGGTYAGLVFDASGAAAQVCDTAAAAVKGAPRAGSAVTLAQGGQSIAVTVDPPTGRVAWP